jgi:hypothetical protein
MVLLSIGPASIDRSALVYWQDQRQWVLRLPHCLRYMLAWDHAVPRDFGLDRRR